MRLIDADELSGITRLLDTNIIRKSKTASFLLDQMLFDIEEQPTVKEERFGRWTNGYFQDIVCTACTHPSPIDKKTLYCPNCGAKMK